MSHDPAARAGQRQWLPRYPAVTVWIVHGVVQNADPEAFGHRNLIDSERFRRFLQGRASQFTDLDVALAGHGEALTVDDATTAAADAAELCRDYGHAVTLFVNGRNVAYQQPYWFALLNALVDGCVGGSMLLGGESFPVDTQAARQRFRRAAKRAALALPCEAARETWMCELGRSAGIEPLASPPPLATLSLARLHRLQALGVRIESHGWTHGDVAAMSLQELGEELHQNAAWLRETLAVVATHYAVPFGAARPPPALPGALYGWWYLVDESLPAGRLDDRLVNRMTLTDRALRAVTGEGR